jgi:circadian clock protein KaiC
MIKSGIPGLDEILGGGFVENSVIGITGAPGTGKSMFALQFASEGCKDKEPCLFVISETSVEQVKREAAKIGLKFDKYEKQNLIFFMRKEPKRLVVAELAKFIRDHKIKRMVLDNITLFEYAAVSEKDFKKDFLAFLNAMKNLNVTVLIITQSNIHNIEIEYKPQDFLFDGLILLTKIRKGASCERCVTVLKMRGLDHSINVYPFKIEKGGIKVYTKQIPFSLK